MRTPIRNPQSGFTLVEISIAAVITLVILGAVGLFHGRSSRALDSAGAVVQAQAAAHQALERVLRELDGASIAHLVPDPSGPTGASDLSFQKPLGVDAAGVVQWSTSTQLVLEPDARETLDGLDNDGDGLVDERQLTLVLDAGGAGERRVVLAHDVPALLPGELANGADDDGDGVIDAPGFCLQRVGNLLNVALATAARGADGRWTSWTERAALRLRN